MRKILTFTILLGLGLSACDRGSSPEDPQGLIQGDDESLQRLVSGIQSDLSRLRQLPFEKPVVSRWVKRNRLLGLLDSIADAQPSTPDTSSGPHPSWTEVLVALDLMESTKSAEEEQREFEGDNIGGFYIPRTNKFWLVEEPGQSESASRTLIAHELAHAMQDQNFPDTISPNADSDEHLALDHLVEGEAEYLGDLWSLKTRSAQEFEEAFVPLDLDYMLEAASRDHASTPLALTLPIYSHYWVGEWSIHNQRTALGWSAIDQLHSHRPRSTKRMLHPFAGPDSLAISEWSQSAFASHTGLVALGSDRLGEVYLAAMLHWRMPSRSWKSSSWMGDRFWLWRAGDSLHHIAAGKVRFESDADAVQFLSKWAAGRGLSANSDAVVDSLEAPRGDTGRVRAVRRGTEVTILYGSHPRAWPTSLADSLWSELVAARPTNVAAARWAGRTRPDPGLQRPLFPRSPIRILKHFNRIRP